LILKFLDQFSIQFASLETGTYNFDFLIEDTFFENFSGTEVKQGRVKVLIELQKQSRMLILDFKLEGSVNLICDRCLDNFDFRIDTSNKLVVKIGTERKEISDEIIMITESDSKINVAQFIYEYIHLALPVKRVHPEEKNCNKEIIEKLKEHNNKSAKYKTDTPWDVLKKIN
jgi:uncharacterized protein